MPRQPLRPLIYVENKYDVREEYRISEVGVRRALGEYADKVDICVQTSDLPKHYLLEEAEYFLGSGFDISQLRQHGRKLRMVHCTSAGVERYLPLDWLPNSAVLTNSSGVHAHKGGLFGLMAVLMLNERMPKHASNQRQRLWDGQLSSDIRGKTAVIVGFGSLGEAIGSHLKSIGIAVVGIRRSGLRHPVADEIYTPDKLKDVLPRADFLILTCPLTSSTRGLIGRKELELLPMGCGILNMARAQIIDYLALDQALRSGRLSGAIADVFDPEPLPSTSFLWNTPNLMITPHVSCDESEGYIDRCLAIFADNYRRKEENLPYINVVSASTEY